MASLLQPEILRRSAVYYFLISTTFSGGIALIFLSIRQNSYWVAVPHYPLSPAQLLMVAGCCMLTSFLMMIIPFGNVTSVQLGILFSVILIGAGFRAEYGAAINVLLKHQVGPVTIKNILGIVLICLVFAGAVYHDFFNKKTRLLAEKPDADAETEQA